VGPPIPDAAIVVASGLAYGFHLEAGSEAIMANVESNGGVKLEESFASPNGKRTLTDVEVASRLGVSRFTVRSWRLKGVGPRFLKMGRAVRYRPQDVDDYERQALVETQAGFDHGPM
jgi:predicted DNA-binding transcriptional regulator AlpA